MIDYARYSLNIPLIRNPLEEVRREQPEIERRMGMDLYLKLLKKNRMILMEQKLEDEDNEEESDQDFLSYVKPLSRKKRWQSYRWWLSPPPYFF
jgi:hypothetical protein